MDQLTCTRCGSTDVIPIVYGMPDFDLAEAEQRGEVILGGCIVILGEDPQGRCRRCDALIPPEPDPTALG